MVRGGSCGGGQSSLGYLFGDFDNPTTHIPSNRVAETPPAAVAPLAGSPSSPQPQRQNPAVDPSSIPAGGRGKRTNNYHRADGQNCGNFITDRPSTKVHAAPGGGSSLGYLFGGNGK